jgi:sugar phosphate isomerase/epimerase
MDERRQILISRRHFSKAVLGAVPILAAAQAMPWGAPLFAAQAKPNSRINGVQLGTITYSFRSMPDQSAEATARYCVESGISAIELMSGPIWSYLGQPSRGGGPGGGRPGGPGGRGRGAVDPATLTASWNGVACAPVQEGGGRRGAGPGGDLAAAARGGRQGGRGAQTPEQQAQVAEQAAEMKKWRESVSMDRVKALRKLFDDAGVTIYATKTINANMSDEELEFNFAVAEALGATHTTLELLEDEAALKRLGDWGLRKKIYVAYHTHTQGSITAFDKAFAASEGNRANVDLGHYVAAGSGDPVAFLQKHHAKIASVHLKDRTRPQNCALNLAWGKGETPIPAILQAIQKNRWTFPASIELEYDVPDGSDAVKEVARCLQFCKAALA